MGFVDVGVEGRIAGVLCFAASFDDAFFLFRTFAPFVKECLFSLGGEDFGG